LSQPVSTPLRYIVTGGPIVAKGLVFEELRARGYTTSEGEIARTIYREFKERLGRHLRVEDRREYSNAVLDAFIIEYSEQKHGLRFYDRGIPDGLGWDRFFGLEAASELLAAVRAYRYDAVLVLDPLDSFEDEADVVWAQEREARRVHELIIQGYVDSGYEPIFVPADSADRRVEFILRNVPALPEDS
jgi:predicted ATPase